MQLAVITSSIKKCNITVQYGLRIFLSDLMTPNTIIQIAKTLSEETLKGEGCMPSDLRFNGKHLEKMRGLIFLAAFRKCIDTRSGTAQVLNIILK